MTSKEEVKSEESKLEDNRIVYQALLKDIQFHKNQQWLITYYVFGIYVFFSTILSQQSHKSNSLLVIFIVMIISVVVMLGGIKLLKIYEEELGRSRERKFKAIDLFHQDIKNILFTGNKNKQDVFNSEEKNNQHILIILATVMIGGWLFVYILAFSKLF